MAVAIPVTAEEVRTTVEAFEAIGTDELILAPTNNRIEQLEGVADAVLRELAGATR